MTPAKKTTDTEWRKVWQCSTHGEFFGDSRDCPKDHVRAYHVMDTGWKRGDTYSSIDPSPAKTEA